MDLFNEPEEPMINFVSKEGMQITGNRDLYMQAVVIPTLPQEQYPFFLEAKISGMIRDKQYDETPVHSPEEYKWKMISALQKTIRRGDKQTSFLLAKGLAHIDTAYVWRRLRIVAYEDIGSCNPLMLGIISHLSKKVNRNPFGEMRTLLWAVEELCDAVKDRTTCDVANLVGYLPVWHDSLKLPEEYTAKMIADFYEDKHIDGVTYQDVCKHYMVLRLLAGDMPSPYADTNSKYPMKRCFKPDEQEWYLDHIGAHSYHKWLFINSLKYSEGMGSSAPALYPEFRKLSEWEVIEEVSSETPDVKDMIDNLPTYAYDGHTMEGKRAFAYWIKSFWSKEELFFKVPEKLRMLLVKSLVFHAEGTKMNKRLITDLSTSILQEQRVFNARYYNLSYEEFMYLVQKTQENLHNLDFIRRKVA